MSNKIEQFNKFLEDNNCLDKYYAEIHAKDLERYIPYDWVDALFIWDSSPQGVQYWQDINDLWYDYLDGKSEE